jgi:hypothetical protein
LPLLLSSLFRFSPWSGPSTLFAFKTVHVLSLPLSPPPSPSFAHLLPSLPLPAQHSDEDCCWSLNHWPRCSSKRTCFSRGGGGGWRRFLLSFKARELAGEGLSEPGAWLLPLIRPGLRG